MVDELPIGTGVLVREGGMTNPACSVEPSPRTGRRSTNCSPITDRLLTTASKSAGMGGASGRISSWVSTPWLVNRSGPTRPTPTPR